MVAVQLLQAGDHVGESVAPHPDPAHGPAAAGVPVLPEELQEQVQSARAHPHRPREINGRHDSVRQVRRRWPGRREWSEHGLGYFDCEVGKVKSNQYCNCDI